MLTRKGQLYTLLLCIFTIMVLGMALFYLSQNAGEFNGEIGRQQYAALKLPYEEYKFRSLFRDQTERDIDQIIKQAVQDKADRGCGMFAAYPYWLVEDKRCVPDYLSLVQEGFDKVVPQRFSVLAKPSLLQFHEGLPSSAESLRLRAKRIWGEDIPFELMPPKNESHSLILTALRPWAFEMDDMAQSGKAIATLEAVPSMRVRTPVDFYTLKAVQELPDKIIETCAKKGDKQIKSCVDALLQEMPGVIRHATGAQGRDVIVALSLFDPAQMDVHFAVRVPIAAELVVGELRVARGGEPLGKAFQLRAEDKIDIESRVFMPSLQGLTLEVCTRPINGGSWSCGGDVIFTKGEFTERAAGSEVQEGSRAIEVRYQMSTFPITDFELRLRARIGDQTADSPGPDIKVFAAK